MHMECMMPIPLSFYNTCIYSHNLNHTNMLCNSIIHYTKNELTWANYQTRAIRFELLNKTHFHTKIYFHVTIHMNSKTLGFTVSSTHQIIGSLCKPEFHCHFRPHTHQYMIYSINHHTNTQISPQQPRTDQKCPKNFQ